MNGTPRERSSEGAPPSGAWSVLRMVEWSGEYLRGKGVARGRLDAEHLLADLLGCGRLELYLQFDRPLSEGELARFKKRLLRRAAREPLQYILGRTPFRDLDLVTDPRVLIPRPETEELVQAVLEWARERSADRTLRALDVGTGSGAIALALAAEGPFAEIVATDPSAKALEVARLNLAASGSPVPIVLREGAGYAPVSISGASAGGERFHVVVSNPPYVADDEAPSLEREIRDWEPMTALLAGPEGLDVLVDLVKGAATHLEEGGLLALEIGETQAERVVERIRSTGRFAPAVVRRDLAGKERIVLAELRSP